MGSPLAGRASRRDTPPRAYFCALSRGEENGFPVWTYGTRRQYPDCMFKQHRSRPRARRWPRGGAGAVRAVTHAAAGGVCRSRGVRVGAARNLLRVDLRRARRRPRRGRAVRRAVGSGANGVLLVRGDDDAGARVRQHLPAPRPRTAGVRCDRPSAAPSSARTTRGRTSSTARCATRRASRTPRASSPREFGLAELRLVNWHGWLFVDPSGQDAEFAEHVAGLEDVVAPYRPEDLTIVARHSYELATNWKVIAENYQECYHCSSIHPGAVPDQPADQRREPPADRLVDGRLDVDHRRGRDHVADRQERRRGDPGPVRARTAHRDVPRRLSRTCSSACTPTTS